VRVGMGDCAAAAVADDKATMPKETIADGCTGRY
jgi:hypothetical protein